MELGPKEKERNPEIVSFYYLLFSHRIHNGADSKDAKKAASDAVSLRYGISRGRLQNIISTYRFSQKVNAAAFRCNALSLISDLEAANAVMNERTRRNEKLISLLKECCDEAGN